ncbi:hypothetical protein BJV78DRAFT_1282729 [Lactifluus subvellereus]|nr:hypothetical protein BJV78DRAFT_1282729 [Lactifluus subvellereus]
MSASVEETTTLNPTGPTEQTPHDQVHSNHHTPPDPSPSTPEVRGKRVPQGEPDLVSQVTQLNNKLVKSYDRVSDLEDDLHVTASTLRSSSVKISQLELERSQHLSALNTGLLVEKSHVTSELTRVMEKATEEAARRGQAESARAAIEKDLDDVSAALFDQANTMVAEARLGRAQSDRKAEEAERALREAEDAVRLMQQELQALQGEKEAAERRMDSMSAAMGKGKWTQSVPSSPVNAHRLLASHVPYQEFLSLITHLRALRATYPQPPAIQSLLGLPLIARLQLEDTDPTVRLDMATALNWLSRRSIIAAIQCGQLTIEPIATQAILASATSPQPPLSVIVLHGSNNANLLTCGLCGNGIVPQAGQLSPTRTGYLSRANGSQFNSWSSSIFRKSSAPSSPSAPPSPPPYHDTSSLPAQIYIFRVSEPSPAFSSALPLCTSGWCLARLRAACSLWSFLRTSILEKIWEEEVQLPPPPRHREIADANVGKPPVPPRRKPKSSSFWGVASSFGLDRVPGWSEGDKDKRAEPEPEKRRFVAPPLHNGSPGPRSLTPPPLPSRNRSRVHTPAPMANGAEGRRPSVPESPAKVSPSSSSDSQRLPVTVKPEESPTLSSLLAPSSEEMDPLNGACPTPSEGPALMATATPSPDDVNKTSTEPEALHESRPAEHATGHNEAPNPEHVGAHPHPPAANAVSVSPPSRTDSPARPPLPRRAAARRAVPPLPPAVPSAPSIPVPAAHVSPVRTAEQPNGHHVQPEAPAEPNSKPDVATAPGSDSPPEGPDNNPPREKEAAEVTGSRSPTSKAEAEIVEAAPEAELSEKTSEEKQPRPPSADDPAEGADEPVSSSSARMVANADGDDDSSPADLERIRRAAEEKAAARAHPAPLPPPRHPRPVRPTERQALSDLSSIGKTPSSPGKFDKPEEPAFAPDGVAYVSDGTWEERTWKELVRLREDMFWARVGSAQ